MGAQDLLLVGPSTEKPSLPLRTLSERSERCHGFVPVMIQSSKSLELGLFDLAFLGAVFFFFVFWRFGGSPRTRSQAVPMTDHRSFPVDGQPVGSAAKLVEALVGYRLLLLGIMYQELPGTSG